MPELKPLAPQIRPEIHIENKQVPKIEKKPELKVESAPLILKTAADFAKLEPKNIHASNPSEELQKILTYMAQIGNKNKIYEVIGNLEKSLLYKTYLNIGIALLNDANPDRNLAYENIINVLQKSNQQWFSKEEFEAFMDFRKRLDQMI
ncbi:MAG: hypothetical protein NVSMB66_5250 [Candidatus Doudnabacteria bacterium]